MTLIIGLEEIQKLKALKEYALAHPRSMDDMLDAMNNPALSPGCIPEFQCLLPIEVKVVFSIDEIPEGKIRHLSVGVGKKDALPTPAAVSGIMKILGFERPINECNIRVEKLEPGYEAIEIGELM